MCQVVSRRFRYLAFCAARKLAFHGNGYTASICRLQRRTSAAPGASSHQRARPTIAALPASARTPSVRRIHTPCPVCRPCLAGSVRRRLHSSSEGRMGTARLRVPGTWAPGRNRVDGYIEHGAACTVTSRRWVIGSRRWVCRTGTRGLCCGARGDVGASVGGRHLGFYIAFATNQLMQLQESCGSSLPWLSLGRG
jgi:hypothetical protein